MTNTRIMRYIVGLLAIIIFMGNDLSAQNITNEGLDGATFTKLKDALENPEQVKRLDLSGQEIQLTDDVLKRFKNLEFLSLKDDHLKEVPHGIVYLTKLKVLDLSGNDIQRLPESLLELRNLEEVFLNSETNLDIDQSFDVLNQLPKLKTLHLENDHLRSFPIGISKLKTLETLYLNNNDIGELPTNIRLPKNLKVIDLQMNKFGKLIDKENRFGKGIIIKF